MWLLWEFIRTCWRTRRSGYLGFCTARNATIYPYHPACPAFGPTCLAGRDHSYVPPSVIATLQDLQSGAVWHLHDPRAVCGGRVGAQCQEGVWRPGVVDVING